MSWLSQETSAVKLCGYRSFSLQVTYSSNFKVFLHDLPVYFYGIAPAAVHLIKQIQMMSSFLCLNSALREPLKSWLRFTWLICNFCLADGFSSCSYFMLSLPFCSERARCISEGYFSPDSCTAVSPSRWLITFDEIPTSKMEVKPVKAILLLCFTKFFLFLTSMNYCKLFRFLI